MRMRLARCFGSAPLCCSLATAEVLQAHNQAVNDDGGFGRAIGVDRADVVLGQIFDVFGDKLESVEHLQHSGREDSCPFLVAIDARERCLEDVKQGLGRQWRLDKRQERVCQLY